MDLRHELRAIRGALGEPITDCGFSSTVTFSFHYICDSSHHTMSLQVCINTSTISSIFLGTQQKLNNQHNFNNQRNILLLWQSTKLRLAEMELLKTESQSLSVFVRSLDLQALKQIQPNPGVSLSNLMWLAKSQVKPIALHSSPFPCGFSWKHEERRQKV